MKHWMVAAGLGLAALAACRKAPEPAAPPSADTRTPVVLPAEAHQQVLREMRQMLQSIGGVTTAAAAGDTALLFAAAAASGSAAAVDPALDTLLPAEWHAFASRAHGRFDTLVMAARRARTPVALKDTVLARVSALVGSCVGCHETYHLVPR
jgi:cytochrome c556